jgi:hypothetical protein
MELRIHIALDTASPMLVEKERRLTNRARLHADMGRAVVEMTSRHVGEWGLSHPNKLGGTRTNYWAGVAAAINPDETLEVSEANATMTLGGDSMAGITRAFGAVTILPGTKTAGVKYLAIPARSEAYGLRPREIPNLVLFWGKGGPAGLKQVDQQKVSIVAAGKRHKGYVRKGKVTGGLVMFWFAKSATVPQDRSLLPSEEEWTEAATAAATDYLERAK